MSAPLSDGVLVLFSFPATDYGDAGISIEVQGGESIPLPLSVYNPNPDTSLENQVFDGIPWDSDFKTVMTSEDGLSLYVLTVTADNENGWVFSQGEAREGTVAVAEEIGGSAPDAFGKPIGTFYWDESENFVSFSGRQLETSASEPVLIRKRIDKASPLIAAVEPTDETEVWPGDSEVGAALLDMAVVEDTGLRCCWGRRRRVGKRAL